MLRPLASLSVSLGLVMSLPLTLSSSACSGGNSSDDSGAAGTGASSSHGGNGEHAGDSTRGGEPSSSGSGALGGDHSGSGGIAGDGASAGDTGGPIANENGLGPAAVALGTASNYAIVAQSAISNVPTSQVTGDLALSPAAASYITGFSLTKAGTSWSSAQVVGMVFAANNDPPTPTLLTTAISDMQTAYTDAAGRKSPDFLNLEGGALGGLTLEPGLYRWTSSVTIPTDVTLSGGAHDVWIFQVTGDLKLSADKAMILEGGAAPANIFWQVAGNVDLGATSHAEGIVLSKTAIKLQTGSTINGRLLAQTAVDIAGATVTAP
jgi:hypothetical protein